MRSEDLPEIKKIFDQFYGENIEFPDYTKFYRSFVVETDGGKIITAGGIRMIPEICLVTDKLVSSRLRVLALKAALKISKLMLKDYEWVHAITDDPCWANQMKRHGAVSRGEALEFDLLEGEK